MYVHLRVHNIVITDSGIGVGTMGAPGASAQVLSYMQSPHSHPGLGLVCYLKVNME